MSTSAFNPQGQTITLTTANPAPTPVQCTSFSGAANQYRILNAGTVTVFLGVGVTSADATSNAVAPPGNVIPLLAGTDEILTFVPNAYFTGNTASGTAVIYITPGTGV